MRIRCFSHYVGSKELEPLEIRNTTVVVDGTRFFFDVYEESGLLGAFGCECDLYAAYLRERLTMFKRANITCYFLFKGAKEHRKFINKVNSREPDKSRQFLPILAKITIREVLREMDFKYVACEYGNKIKIIALAKKLKCPILSLDIEMCFSGVRYIPMNTIQFNESNNTISCKYFFLDNFLQRNNLTEEKLALFIVLTNERIFPQNNFLSFFEHLNTGSLVEDCHSYYSSFFKWLSSNDRNMIFRSINKFISVKDRERFLEEETKALQFVSRQESDRLGATCLLEENAPDWFAKGVAEEHISKTYVNLYRDHQYYGVCSKYATEEEDRKSLTLEIVKYAYDLLTNFNNDGFQLIYGRIKHFHVDQSYSIKKPEWSTNKCVFENGWGSVRSLGLLEHFLRETLNLELRSLERLPVNAQLLIAALVFFRRKKPTNTSAEARCVLLSYVTLSLVFPKADNLPTLPMNDDSVSLADCITAKEIMKEYTITKSNVKGILVHNLLRTLEEFQYCLLALMDLNALCGAPLAAPNVHRSYNGSLVYRLRHAMSDTSNPTQFLEELLSPAPTVYAFFNSLVEAYEDIVNGV